MKTVIITGLFSTTFILACGQKKVQSDTQMLDTLSSISIIQEEKNNLINSRGEILQTRFLTPQGYNRIRAETNSFPEYLRHLPLKPHNSEVKMYDGNYKPGNNIYDAVVDLEIGSKDLHQCADAVMRLRAEYLWRQNQYNKIHFNFTNGFRADYTEWMKGKRIVVKGNSTYWTQTANHSNTYNDFWNYMEIVFSYAGTLSLSKELAKVEINEMKIGDVFIRGGTPGHSIIVVDMAMDSLTGRKIFLLAQSYMPAQEIQILKNPNDKTLSPWYSVDFVDAVETPEWIFRKTELMRFVE
ncbi:MAG: DUF4846 domain-containing protein [Bacteroidota bacterium]